MFADVGMVRRTVDREVERNLHSAAADFVFEPGKIFKGAERRLDRLVSAKFASDRVGHAGLVRFARHGIVAAFSIRVSDGMDRREINHVEPHRFRRFDARQAIAKRRTAIRKAFG